VAMHRRAPKRAIPYPSLAGRLAVLLALPLFGGLTIGTAVGLPASAAQFVSAAQAAQLGTTITIIRHGELAPGLTEVRVASGTGRLLALSPGGDMAAVASHVGPEPGSLTLGRTDGSQLVVPMPGLISAGFAPDETWLAAIDGIGSLWRIDVAAGLATRLADGPFLGSPQIDESGGVLLLSVASVEAPYASRLARVSPDGTTTILQADDLLVYGAQPLDDGSLAVILHQASGTVVVRQLTDGSRQLMANLGAGSINVAIARSGTALAWERAGGVHVQELPAGRPRLLAPGQRPHFAPDGSAVLVGQASELSLFDLRGGFLASFASQAAFEACGEGCAR
jgi:hypothetical protein